MIGLAYGFAHAVYADTTEPVPVAPQITASPNWNAQPRVGQALDVSPGSLNGYFPALTSNTFEVFDGDPAVAGVSVYGPETQANVQSYLADAANEGATMYLRWSVANSEGSDMASVAAPGAVLPAFAAPSATLNTDLTGRTVTAWLTAIAGEPAPAPALVTATIDDGGGAVDVSGSITGAGTAGDPWTFTPASNAKDLDISITISLDNGVAPAWSGTNSAITIPADLIQTVAPDGAPAITGTGVAGETLLSDESDTWTYGGALATVTAREYQLLIDGIVVDGPQAAPQVSIPAGAAGAPYIYQVRVTLSEGPNAQSVWTVIASGTVAEALAAPGVAASDGLAGRRLTITVDSLTGNPAPSVALTALTRDGTDVLGDASGSGPWTYDVPSSAASQAIAWEVTASSTQGSDTASGSENVAADFTAPALSVAFAETSYANGAIIDASDIEPTITDTGNPPLELADLTLILEVDGVPVGLPHTASGGEVLVPRVTASHPTGPIDVSGSGTTVGVVLVVDIETDNTVSVTWTGTLDSLIIAGSNPFSGTYTAFHDSTPLIDTYKNGVAGRALTITPTTGSGAPGQTLTAGAILVLYHYIQVEPVVEIQWQRDGVNLPGATGETYTLQTADAGAEVRPAFTITASGETTVTETGSAVSVAATSSAAINTITGTPSGAVIDYTGTLAITGTPAGAEAEAT